MTEPTGLTAEMVVDGRVPHSPALSPDGRWVVYAVAPVGRTGDHPVSELWVVPADGSAAPRRLSPAPGEVDESHPRWSPDSAAVYYLSDAARRGCPQLRRVRLDDGVVEELTARRRGVVDHLPLIGRPSVAVIAHDEPTEEDARRVAERDDARVWGERPDPARLHLLDLTTGLLRAVRGLADRHVVELAQRPDGGPLAVLTWETPAPDPGLLYPALHLVEDGEAHDLGRAHVEAHSPVWWRDDGGWRLAYLATTPPGLVGGRAIFDLPTPSQVTQSSESEKGLKENAVIADLERRLKQRGRQPTAPPPTTPPPPPPTTTAPTTTAHQTSAGQTSANLIPADPQAANHPPADRPPHRNLTADTTTCPAALTQAGHSAIALFAAGLDTTVHTLTPTGFRELAHLRGLAEHATATGSGPSSGISRVNAGPSSATSTAAAAPNAAAIAAPDAATAVAAPDAAAAGAIAVVLSTAYSAADVYAGPPTGPLRRLTHTRPELTDLRWASRERLAYRAPDGLPLDGLLLLPPGRTRADGPFPLVTLIHGGPYDRHADRLALTWHTPGQWLAAAGYAVFLPNPRGGEGHGHAFAAAVAGAVGLAEWDDVTTGIDVLVADGVADPDRLGIGGWSHGGFMAAWAVARTRRFRAAVVGAGISDWGMLALTGEGGAFEAALAGSAGWEGIGSEGVGSEAIGSDGVGSDGVGQVGAGRKGYEGAGTGSGPHPHDRLSPLSHAAHIRTPVLILHGENDTNVPVSQAEALHRALRRFGVEHEYVVYPRENHSIRERAHQLDVLRRTRSWFDRWLNR